MVNVQKEVQTKLTKGLLDLIVLQLLDTHPMHGYEIITTIRKSFGVYLGPSTVYPLLNGLEKKRYIKSEWNMDYGRPRKVYQLTNDGKVVLNFTATSLTIICKTIGADNRQMPDFELKQVQVGIIRGREKVSSTPTFVH
jgi:PadR family transcriptional regulator PadR